MNRPQTLRKFRFTVLYDVLKKLRSEEVRSEVTFFIIQWEQ